MTAVLFHYRTVVNTSEQGDEGDETLLLDHVAQFALKVVIGVGLQRVLEQDPAAH